MNEEPKSILASLTSEQLDRVLNPEEYTQKYIMKLRKALERARDQLALYKADYSVQKCNEALEDN